MRTRLGVLAACLIAASLAMPARADEASAGKAVDGKINRTLRDLINRGRDFYNAGDPAACYYLYEGALLTVRPLLDHRPDVQKAIDRGLADAARNADMRRRVLALRYVLDNVRSKVKGAGWTAPPPGEAVPPMPDATLWSRLGGEAKVKLVVDDFVAIAATDPAVNFDRDGKLKFTEEQIAGLKKWLIAFISQATGGPLKYTGPSMKKVHKGMGITNAEFDASRRRPDQGAGKERRRSGGHQGPRQDRRHHPAGHRRGRQTRGRKTEGKAQGQGQGRRGQTKEEGQR